MTPELSQTRLTNLGRLEDMKATERKLKIQIDALCKNVNDLFAPMDVGMTYVSKIDLDRLNVHVADIKRKVKELKKLEADMSAVRAELGEDTE